MNTQDIYKDEIQKEIDSINEQLYKQTREKATNGKRVPYREYVRNRSLIWIREIADEEELKEAHNALALRMSQLIPN